MNIHPPIPDQMAVVRASRSLLAYARYVSANYVNTEGAPYRWDWHHQVLCAAIDRLIDPTDPMRFLLVEMPPRHGKSQVVSRLLPAYYAGRNPHREIIVSSYAAGLAQDMNLDTQAIMDRPEHLQVFPHAALPSGRIRTGVTRLRNREAWQLLDPQYMGGCKYVGVGGGLTGKGHSLGVVDDPHKDKKEAMSLTIRNGIWGWWKSVMRTRMAPKGSSILVTQTRWHEDDLAGRIIREMEEDGGMDQWYRLTLPAVCEAACAEYGLWAPDGTWEPYEWREIGDALWPDRMPLSELEPHMADVMTWSALYQQRPVSVESALFRATNWEVVDAAPVEAQRVRFWDMGATRGGDYTCGVLIARDKAGLYYILDVARGQWTPAEIDKAIFNTATQDGKRCTVAWEEEKGASGKYVSSALQRLLPGFITKPVPVSGSKEVRAQPYSAQQAAGNVKLIKAPWNSAFVAEHASFPVGRYDDQVDAGSGAMQVLSSSQHSSGRLRTSDRRLPAREV